MMYCIAVDDEKLVLDLLVDNIRQVPYLQLVKACKNAVEANSILQDNKRAKKDGSLSVWSGENGRRYINIETEHGRFNKYVEMMKKVLEVLPNKS